LLQSGLKFTSILSLCRCELLFVPLGVFGQHWSMPSIGAGGHNLSDIESWLSELGLDKYVSAFAEAEIEFVDLAHLTDEDLKELGLPLGPRRRVKAAIKSFNAGSETPATAHSNITSKQQDSAGTPSVSSSEAERRHLTVMFVDLVGSTEMAGKTDPEDMRTVITGYQDTVTGIVSRFEGFVAKFMGDGVLCYFGWPRANEDDAERAVRAGLSIIDSVRTSQAADGTPLATRVGIATGVVIVGDLIGRGATQEAAVVGETPNLAARLQAIAEPNQLVLPKETQRLLGNAFDLISIGAQELKGVAAPVEAFVVKGEISVESRFAAHQSGTLTPIVGRDREIELMLERWALARSGHGQIVLVSGEAGIGKSRIIRAVIDEIAQDALTRITYQCSPYHTDSAFYPVIQQLSFAAGFTPTDSSDSRLDKLEALLGAENDTLKLVAPMMGLDGTERYGELDLTPAQQRAQTMQALTRLLVRQAEQKPLLVVYEDLHWIDPTSLELLEISLDAITDQHIMILATARPTFEYGFGGHPIVTRFSLNRLGKDQIGAIVSKLTAGKTLPDEIMEIIASRTDGVPLFVEELTKTILESGALKEDGERFVLDGPLSTIAIPTTLHDSLMARLDRLQPIKEVAQTASCIGREFRHGLLAQVSRLPEAELGAALNGLIEAELIYRRGLPPEAIYLFKHALVRDAAYESLLKEKRRAVHARILVALETDTDVAPEVLAVHAEAATLIDRAIDLWEAASKAAIARPAFREGISHLHHATALIAPKIDDGDRTIIEHALSLQAQFGIACLQGVGYAADETKEAWERALILADMIGDTPLRLVVLYALWAGRYVRAEHAEAVPWARELKSAAEKSGDTAQLTLAHRCGGVFSFVSGRFNEAQPFFDQSLAVYDPEKHDGLADRFGQELGVATHVYQSLNATFLGRTRRADQHAIEAENLAMRSGHVNTICYMHGHLIIGALAANDETTLKRRVTVLKPIVEEHNLHVWLSIAQITSDLVKAGQGDTSAIDSFFQADTAMVAAKNRLFSPSHRIEAARRALALGLKNEASDLAKMAREMMEATGEKYAQSDLHRLEAALALDRGDVAAAEASLLDSAKVARQQGGKLWELRAAIDLARLWQEQGRTDEATALLNPVYDSIADGDCPDDRTAAKDLLAVLEG
jgi:class 3 adenylate cyclase/predicted ATPase/ABC-type transport system involved in cytochrome c biogenesis ATPase subunit